MKTIQVLNKYFIFSVLLIIIISSLFSANQIDEEYLKLTPERKRIVDFIIFIRNFNQNTRLFEIFNLSDEYEELLKNKKLFFDFFDYNKYKELNLSEFRRKLVPEYNLKYLGKTQSVIVDSKENWVEYGFLEYYKYNDSLIMEVEYGFHTSCFKYKFIEDEDWAKFDTTNISLCNKIDYCVMLIDKNFVKNVLKTRIADIEEMQKSFEINFYDEKEQLLDILNNLEKVFDVNNSP
ncbi:MAG: hypothetical protein KF896_03335 [Ignavibacteriae bacterium]|nr:hypothetical protein [Ignavibacteriota bacterium]